tara:strand:+ start:560 stop:832 length:273 start_codon:yes stop_codon:yes gene_type:complete
MPITQSAIRRTKRTEVQTAVNKIRKSKYKSAVRRMNNFISSGKIKDAKAFLPEFYSELMKIAKTGVIRKKTASRKISRVTKKIQNYKNKN